MIRRMAVTPAALLILAGCATMGETENGEMPSTPKQCDDSKVQRFIGMQATAEIAQELLQVTGAETLRWAPPRTALTMDFRAERLTVSYDDDMAITRINCG
ncbi:Peptidase inhibitor I78 family protein [Croceibacterium atlanticum]|uniref:Peptidase inhibitor I78 family protein n=2 Tax=Croceibacterium atlanticum TaxID=1267766 RepID=A0A0F7KXP5_9SPHN|nr:Peptidase inhibitor I78 family protein [Croceibacterium atlanticum]